MLRHSYATYYLKNGGDLNRLQLNMGHRDTHLLYTRYTNMVGVTRAMAAEWWQVLPPWGATSPGRVFTGCRGYFFFGFRSMERSLLTAFLPSLLSALISLSARGKLSGFFPVFSRTISRTVRPT